MPYTYILSNTTGSVFFVGSTDDIVKEITEHRSQSTNEFVIKFSLTRLVYVEEFLTFQVAKQREEQLNALRRSKKIQLIETANPHWEDLFQNYTK